MTDEAVELPAEQPSSEVTVRVDWLQLIQDVNMGSVLLPWMLQNATPNYFTYLMTIISSPHREPWMLYKAAQLVFATAPDEVKDELNTVLVSNNFEEISFNAETSALLS